MDVVRQVLPILVVGVLLVAVPTAAPPPHYAIRGARIVPVTGPVIERGTIVFGDGLITAVGATVDVPPEAQVIDGAGLTVYPGLIDGLTTIGLPEAERSETRPEGSRAQAEPSRSPPSRGPEDRPASTPWERAADRLETEDERIERWRSAGFTTAVVASDDGILPGQASVVNLAGERAADMVVSPSVALPVSLEPLDRSAGFPASLMGVLAYVRQVFLDTQHATRAQEAYAKAPRGRKRPEYDRTAHVLAEVLANGRPVLLPATHRAEIVRMLDFARELELSAVLYGAHGAYEAADEIAGRKVAMLVSVKWPERDKDADPEADEPLRVLRFRDRAPSTPAALVEAGVRFAFYSDGLERPREVWKNVRLALDAGLAREAALRAFTQDAAAIFGLGDRLGSLETGKIANVVVTEGALFDEKTTVRHVFVDGRKLDPVPEPPEPEKKPTTSAHARSIEGAWP